MQWCMNDKQKIVREFFGTPQPEALPTLEPTVEEVAPTPSPRRRAERGIKENPYNGSWFGFLLAAPFLALTVYAFLFYTPVEEGTDFPFDINDLVEPVSAFVFQEGMARVKSKENEKYGYIDEHFHLIISPQYDIASEFRGGRALVVKDGLMGYINRKGGFEIPLEYTRLYAYSDQMYCVKHTTKGWGYLDWAGKEVISFGFREAKPFTEGLGAVENNFGSWGFINKENKFVIESEYEDAMPFKGGIAPVKKGGKWGFITKSNRMVVQPTYDEVFENKFYGAGKGYAKVRISDKIFYVNAKGEEISAEAL